MSARILPSICLDCGSVNTIHLTPRDVQVLQQLSTGITNKDAAKALGITEGTLKVYCTRIFEKIGVTGRHAAGMWALRHIKQAATWPGLIHCDDEWSTGG